MSRNIIR